MNNPARAAVAAIECPQCRAQLRLLQPATVHTPISCCMCGATFYIEPVETAPLNDDAPARRPAGGPRAPLRLLSPPPPSPRTGDRHRRPDAPRATALTGIAPAAPTHAAPGMPKPVEIPEHLQRNFRTRWMESVLGAALVLLLVVAACAGGFVLIKAVWTNNRPAAGRDKPTDATTADAAPAADGQSTTPPTDEPIVAQAKPLTRPEWLVGGWASRADDGSHSRFDFLPDGKVVVASAVPGLTPFEAHWFLVEQRDKDLVIEVGPEFGAAGNHRFVFRNSGTDAFTVIRTVHRGIPNTSELRYVRDGPPQDSPAPAPAAAPPPAGPPTPPAEPAHPSP